jgi:hypothetical protein
VTFCFFAGDEILDGADDALSTMKVVSKSDRSIGKSAGKSLQTVASKEVGASLFQKKGLRRLAGRLTLIFEGHPDPDAGGRGGAGIPGGAGGGGGGTP